MSRRIDATSNANADELFLRTKYPKRFNDGQQRTPIVRNDNANSRSTFAVAAIEVMWLTGLEDVDVSLIQLPSGPPRLQPKIVEGGALRDHL